MKACLSFLRTLIRAVTVAVSLVFVVIEGTLLLTGDFLLYASPAVAFLQLCLRLAIPATAFAVSLLSLCKRQRSFFFESLCLLIATAAIAPFLSNRIGIGVLLLATLFAAVNYKK